MFLYSIILFSSFRGSSGVVSRGGVYEKIIVKKVAVEKRPVFQLPP
jgi:hypothetical protein